MSAVFSGAAGYYGVHIKQRNTSIQTRFSLVIGPGQHVSLSSEDVSLLWEGAFTVQQHGLLRLKNICVTRALINVEPGGRLEYDETVTMNSMIFGFQISSAFAYNPTSDSWSSLAGPPQYLDSPSAVALQNKIYVQSRKRTSLF